MINNILNGIRGENKARTNEKNIEDFSEEIIMENSKKNKGKQEQINLSIIYTLTPLQIK